MRASTDKQEFFAGIGQGQEFNLNDLREVHSRNDVLPTIVSPIVAKMQFTMEGRGGGIYFISRTDGIRSGRFGNEFATELVFIVEYNGATIDLYDRGNHTSIAKYVPFPHLQLGVVYDVRYFDGLTEAGLTLSQGGTVIADLRGAVPAQAG